MTRTQIEKIAARVEALANRRGAGKPWPPVQVIIVHSDGQGRFAACCRPGGSCAREPELHAQHTPQFP
jgi:hypothetical protein